VFKNYTIIVTFGITYPTKHDHNFNCMMIIKILIDYYKSNNMLACILGPVDQLERFNTIRFNTIMNETMVSLQQARL